jgi:hypothetical protein
MIPLGQKTVEQTSLLLRSKNLISILECLINRRSIPVTLTRMLFSFVSLVSIALILSLSFSCSLGTNRPKLEMSLAASAFVAAKEANARVVTPGLFKKAEVYFLKAKSAYKNKYFGQAKQYAILSKQFSEQAEYQAIKQATMKPSTENTIK